jgi:hypothetical protein
MATIIVARAYMRCVLHLFTSGETNTLRTYTCVQDSLAKLKAGDYIG